MGQPVAVTVQGNAFNCRRRPLETVHIGEGSLTLLPGQEISGTVAIEAVGFSIVQRFAELQALGARHVEVTGKYHRGYNSFASRIVVASIKILGNPVAIPANIRRGGR